jgi:hypothetical protein
MDKNPTQKGKGKKGPAGVEMETDRQHITS